MAAQIKSDNTNLTLNADGSNDIKFQSNGVEKASIDSSGNVAASGTITSNGQAQLNNNNLISTNTGSTGEWIGKRTSSGEGIHITTTNASGTDTQRLAITCNADSADFIVKDSDIVFGTAGKGIVLGSTTNVDANTLDDYEEGTWTPTILASLGTNPTVSGTMSGTYTKIGNRVTLSFQGDSISVSGTTDGNLKFGGLPFSNSDDGKSCGTWTTYLVDFVRPNMAGVLTNLSDGIGCLSTADDASWGWELVNIMDGGTSFRASYSYLTTS